MTRYIIMLLEEFFTNGKLGCRPNGQANSYAIQLFAHCLKQNLNLNSLLVKRQIDNPSLGGFLDEAHIYIDVSIATV